MEKEEETISTEEGGVSVLNENAELINTIVSELTGTEAAKERREKRGE